MMKKVRTWRPSMCTIVEQEEFLLARVERAVDLFLKWKEARPLLAVSQSAYAKGLIQFILDVYEEWYDEEDGPDEYEEFIVFLRKLLTDPPPHHTPPQARKAPGGAFI